MAASGPPDAVAAGGPDTLGLEPDLEPDFDPTLFLLTKPQTKAIMTEVQNETLSLSNTYSSYCILLYRIQFLSGPPTSKHQKKPAALQNIQFFKT